MRKKNQGFLFLKKGWEVRKRPHFPTLMKYVTARNPSMIPMTLATMMNPMARRFTSVVLGSSPLPVSKPFSEDKDRPTESRSAVKLEYTSV